MPLKMDDIHPLFIITFIQMTLITSHSSYVTTNQFLVVFMITSHFYHGTMEDYHINS